MKKIFLALAAVVIAGSIFFAIEKPFYAVPILAYHSINYENFNADTARVNPQLFARQMGYIHRRGYRVISLDELTAAIKTHKKLKNVVAITFDDGYEDNYTYAFPVFKKYGFPAAIFLIPKHLGNPRFLKYQQIKEMEGSGITFGSHTLNHTYLPAVKNETDLRMEIFGSKEFLEKILKHRIDYLCFPLGGYNEHIIELIKEAGYTAAFTTNRGKDKLNGDIYALKRIKITNNDSWLTLWFKMSGYYYFTRAYKQPN